MGAMPFHLEKGWLGLRFDYVARSPEVRDFVIQQLRAGRDPIDLARNIQVSNALGSAGIDLLNAPIQAFKSGLTSLWGMNNYRFDDDEKRTAAEYDADQPALDTRNRDTGGNRAAFMGYWLNAIAARPALKTEMAAALLKAFESKRERLDFWWDCSLADTDQPAVVCSLDVPRVARVFFCTPHPGTVESHLRNELVARPPFDEGDPLAA